MAVIIITIIAKLLKVMMNDTFPKMSDRLGERETADGRCDGRYDQSEGNLMGNMIRISTSGSEEGQSERVEMRTLLCENENGCDWMIMR